MRRLHWACVLTAVVSATAVAGDPDPDVTPTAAWLGHPHRRPIVPPDCPPAPLPFDPTRPPPVIDPTRPPTTTVPPTTDPTLPPPAATDPVARAPEAGTLAPGTFNPNMFGDLFGSRPRPLLFAGQQRTFQAIMSDAAGQPIPFSATTGDRFLVIPRTSFIVLRDNGGASAPFQTNFPTAIPVPPIGNVPLLENSDVTTRLQGLNPGATVLFQSGTGLNQSPVSGEPGPFFVEQNYQIASPIVAATVVLPSSGGVVGRTKISEDNNPVPGDRFIFNYDLYGGTVLVPGGYDVHRFSIGGECSFFQGLMSAELRMPFASTLDPVGTLGGLATRSTEWGNLNLTLKALVLASDGLDVATGVGIAFPTAADAVVRGPNGNEILRVKNQSYMITPFIAAGIIPSEGWFAQGWVQISYDVTGSDVLLAPSLTSPAVNVGTVHDAALLQTDVQVGYWLIRNPGSDGLRGLAPYMELHYNRPLNTSGAIISNGLVLAGAGTFNELNLSVGAAALIGSNMMVSVGMAFPLRDGLDRFFDYQFGVRANWFFGPGARTGDACAAYPYPAPAVPGPGTPPMPGTGPAVVMPPPGTPAAPAADPVVRAPETGTLAPATFNPNFFGDQIGTSTRSVAGHLPVLPRYQALKPTDNDGPRPSDRVYYSFNHYENVNASVNPPGTPELTFRRQVIGLETMIGDDASVGVRVPFLQLSGSPEFTEREVGDMSIVGKYAFINDPWSGNVATLGLTVTLPTGGRGGLTGIIGDGDVAPRAVFVQPWAGAVWSSGDAFVQGVTSLVLPTDPIYPVIAFNSVGAGYWLYRNGDDQILRGIAPVIELHVNTPLTNRNEDAPIFLGDQFNLTSGVYLQFPRLTLGSSVCVPLAGPKPYDWEAMVSVNYQF